jgi:hypothetical protein
VCKDPDDQKFIDLAAALPATLLSKDAQVLALARRLERLGVSVLRCWPIGVRINQDLNQLSSHASLPDARGRDAHLPAPPVFS